MIYIFDKINIGDSMNNIVINSLLITFSCFLITTILVPIVKKIAHHVNALDIPNERKVHKTPIPRLGGLAIYIGFIFGYLFFIKQTHTTNAIVIGSFVLLLTGIIDDIKPVKAKYKLIGQIIACLIVIFYGNVSLNEISAFGIYINFKFFKYVFTLILMLACINCMNLIDGLDGLASGISIIFYLIVGIITIFIGSNQLDYKLCFIMLGSCLGFLVYNFYPAKIFMGDSGSMFLGYMVSIMALLGFKNVTLTSFFIPFMIIAIPFLDTFFAILRRYFKGEDITKPDKFHIHHQLLNMNFSHKTTVIIIWVIDLLFAVATLVYILVDNLLGYLLYGILLVLVFIFILKTNVVFDKEKKFSIFKKRH